MARSTALARRHSPMAPPSLVRPHRTACRIRARQVKRQLRSASPRSEVCGLPAPPERAAWLVSAGTFSKGVPNGQGVWTYANGDVYKGGFVHGAKHGVGSYHFAKAQCQFVGTFEAGAFVHGRWIHRDGSYVLGWFEQAGAAAFVPSGEATCKFARPALVQDGVFGPGMSWAGGAISAA